MKDNHFKVNPYISYFDSIEAVHAELEQIQERRLTLDYLIDGRSSRLPICAPGRF